MNLDDAAQAFKQFATVIKRLRTPGTGCPWDLEQTHKTLRPFLVEEAYETLDAIDAGDDQALRDELGDLLLQVVLHAQVADDRGAFSITEVIGGIESKMVRRHPHVFGSTPVQGSEEVVKNWEEIKVAEAADRGHDASPAAALARLPVGLPALQRAQRLGEKAAKRGRVDESPQALLTKARDAFAKLEAAMKATQPSNEPSELEQELGQLLFDLCQFARCLGVSAEDSLRARNQRFIESFRDAELRQTPSAT
jgi:MazG family protein